MDDYLEALVGTDGGLSLTANLSPSFKDQPSPSLNDSLLEQLLPEEVSANSSTALVVSGCIWDLTNAAANCSWENRASGNDTSSGDVPVTDQQPEKVYWALMLVILPFLAVFGNILIILSVYKERTLQSATNYFIVSLAFADLLVAAAAMPFAVYVLVNVDWELSDTLCDFYIAIDVTCSTASIFNLVAISIDRFIAVTQPIKYSKHKNSKRVALTIVFVWVVSAAIGSPIMLGLNTSPERVPHLCVFYNSDFILYSSLSSFYIPCIVMVFLYYKIFKVIHDRARKALAKKEPRLKGIIIQNATNAQSHHETRIPQNDKNGNKGLQIAAVPEQDLMTTNTGSRSQPDEDEYDDLPIEAAGDKSPDRDDDTSFLRTKPKPANIIVVHNRNHDSGYAASHLEETQFLSNVQAPRLPDTKRNGTAVPLLTVSVARDAPSSTERDAESQTTPVKKKSRFNLGRKHKSSRRKREKASAKRERKATKTLAIVLGVFLICWVPFFTCNVIEAVCMKLQRNDCHLGVTVFLLTTWLGYMNSCVNPVIYTIFNPEFRKAFKKLLLEPTK